MNNTLYRVNEKDWIYNNQQLTLPESTYNEEKRAFWQSEVHKYSCSLHACITAITNQYPIVTYSLEDRKNLLAFAVTKGFSKEWGWYMSSAVACVAEWSRKNKGIELNYYRVNWKHYRKLAYLGFGVITGFQIKEGFGNDRFDDGELNGSSGEYTDIKYGHLVSLWAVKKFLWYKHLIYVDNYADKHKYNETKINHRFLAELVADDCLFKNGYVYSLK